MNHKTPTPNQLRKAAVIREKVIELERQYDELMGGKDVKGPVAAPKRFFPGASHPAQPKKRVLSDATKAKLSAIAKARWAKARKAGKQNL